MLTGKDLLVPTQKNTCCYNKISTTENGWYQTTWEGYEAYQKRKFKKLWIITITILHTDATSPDDISRITTVPEIKLTGCMTGAIFIVDGIIKNGYVVDLLSYTSPGNNIPTENGCVKKV